MAPVHVALLVLSLVYASYAVPVPLNTTNYHTVLMIGAHPDDIEACSGGLANQLHAQGATVINFYNIFCSSLLKCKKVWFLITTNGDKGCGNSMCFNWTSADIAYAREHVIRCFAIA